MTPSRKKPGVAFWATVVVLVGLSGYPLSMGPACWISSRMDTGAGIVTIAYQPINWIRDCPVDSNSAVEGIEGILDRYSQFGAADGWCWRICIGDDGRVEPGSRWSEHP